MEKITKLLGTHSLIAFLYSVLALISIDAILLALLLAAVHVLVCFSLSVLAFIDNRPKEGSAYLLIVVLIFLIGSSVCTYG